MTRFTPRLLMLLGSAFGPLGCASLAPAPPTIGGDAEVAAARQVVTVFYPAGECPTGVIEVQVFDRAVGDWIAHPEHPQVEAGTCQPERSDQLLNEFRVRCIDPAGALSPSDWVEGAMTSLTEAGDATSCPPAEAPEAPEA